MFLRFVYTLIFSCRLAVACGVQGVHRLWVWAPDWLHRPGVPAQVHLHDDQRLRLPRQPSWWRLRSLQGRFLVHLRRLRLRQRPGCRARRKGPRLHLLHVPWEPVGAQWLPRLRQRLVQQPAPVPSGRLQPRTNLWACEGMWEPNNGWHDQGRVRHLYLAGQWNRERAG